MTERFISVEENGAAGAQRKAGILIEEGYAVISIIHTQVPQAGSTSTPYARNYGKMEKGYSILADDKGYPDGVASTIPEIIEC